MAMRATTVRFTEDLWDLLEAEAAAEGASAAQFVREATIMRIAFTMGRRGDERLERTLERLTGRAAHEEPRPAKDPELEPLLRAVRDPERLDALRATGLLDSEAEERFDRYARLAAEVLNAPAALVSLVDEDRQFFKACLGLPEPWASRRETPLTHSFCQHAVKDRAPLVVSDAREHPDLRDNLAISELNVIAYAGVPLRDGGGQALGTLCVLDTRPRHWTSHQIGLLQDLAASVVTEIEHGRAAAPAGG